MFGCFVFLAQWLGLLIWSLTGFGVWGGVVGLVWLEYLADMHAYEFGS